MTPIEPGRFNCAAIHSEAGEAELRLSTGGNWQLRIRAAGEQHWQLACSGDLSGGAITPQLSDGPLRLGALTLDRVGRRAVVRGREVRFSALEFDLLATLASQPTRVFTKQDLLRDVWGYRQGCISRTVDSHASRVRRKLARAGADGFVVNCRNVGYKLWNGIELAAAGPQRAA
jgi:DNA-binding response OmpR family regulator